MQVYLNGGFLGAEEARVSASDQGLLLGLGAFETLRAYGGRPFRLQAHLDRLADTLAWLGLQPREPVAALGEAATELLARTGLREARVRITVTAGPAAADADPPGPTSLVTVAPLGAPPAEAYRDGVAVTRHPLPLGLGPGAGRKVTSYLGYVLARRAAERAGAAEAVLEAPDGQLVEGAYANLFVVREGRVLTPPLVSGALPGVTRAAVLELLPSCGLQGREQALVWDDLLGAEEAFLTSSIAEILPVTQVAGAAVGAGRPGPLTILIHKAFQRIVAEETGAPDPCPRK